MERNNEKFCDHDQEIFNFVSDELSKNSSTKIPMRLVKLLSTYAKSIGQIACGRIRGTCFLVTDELVMTNQHVFMDITGVRQERQDPILPITVSFDYYHHKQREHVITIQLEEVQDPRLENSSLDYKFLRLKENRSLANRVPLGSLVRSRPPRERRLQADLVVIIGHPGGNKMHQETCAVVGSRSWIQKMKKRQACEVTRQRQMNAAYTGMHMTSGDLLHHNEEYRNCLPYDTSLFSGASGSPVFDLNGNIIAMHTQGYTLKVAGGKCSLMQFGVQFRAICEDLERKRIDVEGYFPNYNSEEDVLPNDEDDGEQMDDN